MAKKISEADISEVETETNHQDWNERPRPESDPDVFRFADDPPKTIFLDTFGGRKISAQDPQPVGDEFVCKQCPKDDEANR